MVEPGPSRVDAQLLVKRLASHSSIPIIVIAEGADPGSDLAVELLSAGALDVLPRSRAGAVGGVPLAAKVVGSVRILSRLRRGPAPATVRPPFSGSFSGSAPAPAYRSTVPPPPPSPRPQPNVSVFEEASAPKTPPASVPFHPRQVLLIGASTGGTEAIKQVLTQLPREMPGICIVQHIPAAFSKSFANRLNTQCELEVREAVDGDHVRPGLALVAPGGYHMELHWKGDRYLVRLTRAPEEHHQRPAVDVLFRTAAAAAGRHALAVLLTGMGRDGALGMKCIREAGGINIAQDEKSSVVFGMPAAAQELGVVDQVAGLGDMHQVIQRRLASLNRQAAA